MPIPSSGSISMDTIRRELYTNVPSNVSLNDSYVRLLPRIPSGAISLADFRGTTATPVSGTNFTHLNLTQSAARSYEVYIQKSGSITVKLRAKGFTYEDTSGGRGDTTRGATTTANLKKSGSTLLTVTSPSGYNWSSYVSVNVNITLYDQFATDHTDSRGNSNADSAGEYNIVVTTGTDTTQFNVLDT
jgi:hypothetical protein